ncbi:MAG: MFS transporter [Candidatus Spechtbacteria bacterium]|nr:MFS transporter [Candidatus Spechtbacteria bacterium]
MINPIRGLTGLQFVRLPKGELSRTYMGIAVRDLAFNLAAIFEPIYLYLFFKDNFSFSPLALVCIYYATFYVFLGLFSPLGAKLASKIGFRWIGLISSPLRGSYYIILALLPVFPYLLPFALLALSVSSILYWPGFHVFLAHVSNRPNRATSIGMVNIIGTVAAATSPVLGGIILVLFNYTVLFSATFVLLLISIFMFWFSPKVTDHYNEGIFSALKKTLSPNSWRISVPFIASGIEERINGIMWPLFLFLLAVSYSSLGLIITISLVISLVVTYIMARASDKFGEEKILEIGIMQQIFSCLGRIIVNSPLSAAVVHGFYGFSSAMTVVPFSSILYRDISNSGESYAALIIREQSLNIGRVILLCSSAVFFMFSSNFIPIFILAAVATAFKSIIILPKN